MRDEIKQWVEEQDGLEVDGKRVVDKHGRVVIRDGRHNIEIIRSGERVAQGEFSRVDGRWLYIEGTRSFGPYPEHEDYRELEGEVAVYWNGKGPIEVDGP